MYYKRLKKNKKIFLSLNYACLHAKKHYAWLTLLKLKIIVNVSRSGGNIHTLENWRDTLLICYNLK